MAGRLRFGCSAVAGATCSIAVAFAETISVAIQTVRADGSPAFLLRDSTAPMIVFLPALLTTGGHWIARRSRTRLSVS
jgi:hypothetical protein